MGPAARPRRSTSFSISAAVRAKARRVDDRLRERGPRRHADRLGRADQGRRRPRPSCRRLSPARGGRAAGDPDLRPVRQVAPLRGSLHRSVAPHGRSAPRRPRWIHEQVPELGGRRSREVGARRLCLRSRRLARRRPFPGPPRHLVDPRGPRSLSLHRVGGRSALEQRQGRSQRNLLLCDEPVAGGGASAAASLRDLRLGGRGRLLPRPQPPRWHPLHVRARVVPLASHSRPARPRHEGIPEPDERRLGLRATDLDRGGARRQPPRLLRGLLAKSARQRRVLALAHARLVENNRAALLGGQLGRAGLHPRGNFEGFVRSASKQKWLEVHGIEHWTHFYTDYGVALQKKFFGHFLKGEDTGWKKQPKVMLQVRHPGERFVERSEKEWPLARTRWTKLYLSSTDQSLSRTPVARRGAVSYDGLGEGVTFLTPPLTKETEITGPIAAKLHVSSQTADADPFLIVRVLTANMKEVVFQGALDPHTPIAQGWLRASHRKLDPKLTLPYRPYHTHDEKQPLAPGKIYELDVEIWPTSIVAPA